MTSPRDVGGGSRGGCMPIWGFDSKIPTSRRHIICPRSIMQTFSLCDSLQFCTCDQANQLINTKTFAFNKKSVKTNFLCSGAILYNFGLQQATKHSRTNMTKAVELTLKLKQRSSEKRPPPTTTGFPYSAI